MGEIILACLCTDGRDPVQKNKPIKQERGREPQCHELEQARLDAIWSARAAAGPGSGHKCRQMGGGGHGSLQTFSSGGFNFLRETRSKAISREDGKEVLEI